MAERRPLRVLIVDDEPLGCERIAQLLEEEPDVEVVGVAENGREAVEAIRELEPDLVFLDIQMPRMNGLEVVREIGPAEMPTTIFVTAYDQHALEAFELAAVDYLVKPYDDERFEEAFRRALRKLELEGLERLREQMLRLLQAEAPAPLRYLDRIAVRMRGKLRVVPIDTVDYITASGVYAELHTRDGERHVVRESLQALEEQLDPEVFMRIHRSVIVRLDRIELMMRGRQGRYLVRLEAGTELPVGRSRRAALERRLGRV